MRIHSTLAIFLFLFFLTACDKQAEDLPTPDAVMVKFVNKTGKNLEDLVVSRARVGSLGKGKSSSDYFRYESLGQQYGYALVEAVATIEGKNYYTSSSCQGICGTPSAPAGTWLEPDHYNITIHIDQDEPDALEFRVSK